MLDTKLHILRIFPGYMWFRITFWSDNVIQKLSKRLRQRNHTALTIVNGPWWHRPSQEFTVRIIAMAMAENLQNIPYYWPGQATKGIYFED